MKPFDLSTAPLEGVSLIEASAGTGKTFTLTGLCLRLIVEQGLRIDQILVVTFNQRRLCRAEGANLQCHAFGQGGVRNRRCQ